MPGEIDKKLENFIRSLPSEEIYFEAIREILKDIIKEYIKKKINSDDHLKHEIVEVLKEFTEAKVKEYDSMAKMTRISAKLGYSLAPESLKDEAISNFLSVFQKEIEDIIRKTL